MKLRDGKVLSVKADDKVLTGEVYSDGGEDVKLNARLLKSILCLDGCNVRVKGTPRRGTMKKPIGTDNVVMDAVGIKVMIPKPKSGEIDELIEMRTCLGVGKRRHGWFTKSGRFEVE
eukprot:CAMPEP_0118640070 /NCGR_PEP_ID=MMETSP0785-20121206/4559_1 /TAXON_ID=91992 /ORGANISM="Bolidomonas pacifica, Strain CCMP 1866" /LENGTH=116 /DNA_ID=CAMNT_0006531437 /DNA_START=87 /DNA_END=434 /DNA_ORIENTATION=-